MVNPEGAHIPGIGPADQARALQAELNRWGREGWELIQWEKGFLFLRRELRENPYAF